MIMSKPHHPLTFQGAPLTLVGREVKVGDALPDFTLVGMDMANVDQDRLQGRKFLIAAVPSLDTPVCSVETKRFSQELSAIKDAGLLAVSMDLPFAQKRWCGMEGVENVVAGSDYKYRTFGEAFGVLVQEWGLLSRAVFVVNSRGTVVHVEYVAEISAEPDYDAALEALKNAE